MATETAADPLFLGLDSSTQGLKAIAVDAAMRVTHSAAVNFDADLPRHGTRGGVHRSADGLTVTSPPLLWVEALDLLLARLRDDGFPFQRVVAVSNSGQQHGSVYFRHDARALLQNLQPGRPLAAQLADAFAVTASPVWMDSSTRAQCEALETALGGPQATAERTGSRAFERFTGNQIAKIAATQPDAYAATERIALVSSFIASLLTGDYAPIDTADGAGMNLMNLRTKDWDPVALAATAPGLAARLGPLVPAHTVVGAIAPALATAWGFPATCAVIAGSGDNPCSLAGLRLQESGDIAISLGTSDTLFGSLREPRPSAEEGHIFGNPVDPDGYMALLCYKNGSLTREKVRDRCTNRLWKTFDEVLEASAPGNGGHLGLYIQEPEITPPIFRTGIFRFGPDGEPAPAFDAATEVRAVVEGQFLSMRWHSGNIGIRPRRILATGGTSRSTPILQIIADVFGVEVYRAEVAEAAALGAAYRARHGWLCRQANRWVPFAEAIAGAPPFQLAAQPRGDAAARYAAMLPRYIAAERRVLAGG